MDGLSLFPSSSSSRFLLYWWRPFLFRFSRPHAFFFRRCLFGHLGTFFSHFPPGPASAISLLFLLFVFWYIPFVLSLSDYLSPCFSFPRFIIALSVSVSVSSLLHPFPVCSSNALTFLRSSHLIIFYFFQFSSFIAPSTSNSRSASSSSLTRAFVPFAAILPFHSDSIVFVFIEICHPLIPLSSSFCGLDFPFFLMEWVYLFVARYYLPFNRFPPFRYWIIFLYMR